MSSVSKTYLQTFRPTFCNSVALIIRGCLLLQKYSDIWQRFLLSVAQVSARQANCRHSRLLDTSCKSDRRLKAESSQLQRVRGPLTFFLPVVPPLPIIQNLILKLYCNGNKSNWRLMMLSVCLFLSFRLGFFSNWSFCKYCVIKTAKHLQSTQNWVGVEILI